MRMSVLGDALKTLSNAEKRGKRQVLLRPSSKVVIKVLQVMQSHGTLERDTSARALCQGGLILRNQDSKVALDWSACCVARASKVSSRSKLGADSFSVRPQADN
jgi:ribosomal protein S8